MLTVEGLHVRVGGREVLRGIDLCIGPGQSHVLLGPNACGKTTLVLAILGYPALEVTGGSILFDGRDLHGMTIAERARLGIGLAHQNPPDVRGVKLGDVIRLVAGAGPWDAEAEPEETIATPFLERVGLDAGIFLSRDLNLGYSGGEKKRSELAQVFAMKARLMLLDEPDSGVDIDSVKLIGTRIGGMAAETGSSLLVVTHHRHILQYLRPDVAHVMCAGRIVRSGRPAGILREVETAGYEQYAPRRAGRVRR